MSKFIRHLPCPSCGSRDNMGEYEDNFYCFGCGYYKPKKSLDSVRARLTKNKEPTTPSDITTIITDINIPTEPKKWLLKYGITDVEINQYNIGWNEEKQLLLLIATNSYWQCRNFGTYHKGKYVSSGVKDTLIFYGDSDKLVVVEDVLSAIKVARLSPEYCALPLMGSTMPLEWARKLSERFKQVRIWLDRDKAKESLRMAKIITQLGVPCNSVITEHDPKEYSKNQIKEILDD